MSLFFHVLHSKSKYFGTSEFHLVWPTVIFLDGNCSHSSGGFRDCGVWDQKSSAKNLLVNFY